MEIRQKIHSFDLRAHEWWLQPLTLVATFAVLDRGLRKVLRLSPVDYGEKVIVVEAIEHAAQHYSLLAMAMIVAVVVGAWTTFRGGKFSERLLSPFEPWTAIDNGSKLKVLTVVSASILVWYLATLPPNYYFGQTYAVDRVLMVLVCGLLLWRPVFVFPLLLLVIPFVGQLDYPLNGYSWAGHALPRGVLMALASFLVVRVAIPEIRARSLVLVVCSLVATNYFWSGVEKIELNWLIVDEIQNLLPATYLNGWLIQFDQSTIEMMTRWLSAAGGPLKLFTIVAEVGAIGFFSARLVPRFFLMGWTILHVGIFVTTGICFWMWVAVDITILVLFFGRDHLQTDLFDLRLLAISIILIAAGNYWARPIALAWLDSPVSYSFRFEAILDDGSAVHLPPHFFAPNDYETTLGALNHLLNERRLPISWGAIRDHEILELLEQADTEEEIQELERVYGYSAADTAATARVDGFFRRFVAERNKTSGLYWWRIIAAPRILWTFAERPAYQHGEKLAGLRIVHLTSHYHDGRFAVVRRVLVRDYHF